MTKLQRSLSLAVSTGLTAAQVVADLGFVPGLSPAVTVLVAIARLCENVKTNRNAIKQLYRRCCAMTEELNDASRDEQLLPAKIKAATDEASMILQKLKESLETWAALSFVKSFMSQQDISDGVRRANEAIDRFIETFILISHLETHQWQASFTETWKMDQDQVADMIIQIDFKQEAAFKKLNEHTEMVNQMMSMLQLLMSTNPISGPRHSGLTNTLYDIHSQKKGILPDMGLEHGEVCLLGKYPIAGNLGMDVWQGTFLGKEPVACHMIRAGREVEEYMKRFAQEQCLWRALYEKDKGEHIVPVYGVVRHGPHPYYVTPWYRNGTAIDYVKREPSINHRKFIKAIAKGVEVLHTMDPPVVHGDLRGVSIVVSDINTPLLADSGMPKLFKDVGGKAYERSTGIQELARWQPPELLIREENATTPELLSKNEDATTATDIYFFGMTVLELLTGKLPWSQWSTTQGHCVIIDLSEGGRPHRPVDDDTIKKGLNDGLWALLQRCWLKDPAQRPSIQTVVQELEIIWPEPVKKVRRHRAPAN